AKERAEVARGLAVDLAKDPDVWAAYTADQLAVTAKQLADTGRGTSDALRDQLARSFLAERCDDVVVVPRPYSFFLNHTKQLFNYETTHGSPHAYDTHVLLLIYGPGVRPGHRKARTSPLTTTAILAHALGVKLGPGAEPLPEALFDPY